MPRGFEYEYEYRFTEYEYEIACEMWVISKALASRFDAFNYHLRPDASAFGSLKLLK